MKKALTMMAVFGSVAVFAQDSDTDVNVNMGGMGVNVNVRETYSEAHTTSGGEVHYIMQGYNGTIGCPWPMEEDRFADALRSVASKDFEDTKLTVAKQIAESNCVTADQVRKMMDQFDFEDSKLDYAKFAYGKTFDMDNYYKLNDAFEFESSSDELSKYVRSY